MNVRSIAAITLALFLLTVVLRADDQAQEEKLSKELIGTWKLVSGKINGQDLDFTNKGTALKHITPTHMTVMSIGPDNEEVKGVSCGKWSLQGDQYSETPEFGRGGSFLAVKGLKNTFTCKIVGDRWYSSGKLKIHESSLNLEEVWERQRPEDPESNDDSTK
jgi:hypothetical protein